MFFPSRSAAIPQKKTHQNHRESHPYSPDPPRQTNQPTPANSTPLLDTFKGWNRTGHNQPAHPKIDRCPSVKRSSSSMYDQSTKRTKNEQPKSELLQQLMSDGNGRNRHKGGNWLSEGRQKAACVSQPSESVLMNLLVSGFDIRAGYICLAPAKSKR